MDAEGRGLTGDNAMPLADLIGSLAAFLTTASFLPQAAKVLRTRETEAISLVMYSMGYRKRVEDVLGVPVCTGEFAEPPA